MNDVQAALAWCPFPDVETARYVSAQLLKEKLIACANILPGIESVFEFEGRSTTAVEVAVLFKTTFDRLEVMVERLGEIHPYDTPAIVGWNCDAAHPATLGWLNASMGGA